VSTALNFRSGRRGRATRRKFVPSRACTTCSDLPFSCGVTRVSVSRLKGKGERGRTIRLVTKHSSVGNNDGELRFFPPAFGRVKFASSPVATGSRDTSSTRVNHDRFVKLIRERELVFARVYTLARSFEIAKITDGDQPGRSVSSTGNRLG